MNGIQHSMEMDMAMDMKLSPTSLTGSSSPALQHPSMALGTMTPTSIQNVGASGTSTSHTSSSIHAPSTSSVAEVSEQQQCQQEQQASQESNMAEEKEQCRVSNDNGGSLDMSEADDQSLSLAVEMAAVNQAIIALSGQTPVPPVQAMKTEKD